MSAQTVSYSVMAQQVAYQLGLIPETIPDEVTWTEADQRRIAIFITNATTWAYLPANANVIWPFLVQGKSLTLSVEGTFDAADVDYSTRLALWTADPRPANAVTRPVTFTLSGSTYYPELPQDGLYCLYIAQPPRFSSIAYSPTTAYPVDAVVYDPASGDCFRALVANTGVALTDTATWAVQKVSGILANAVQQKAIAYWQDMKLQSEQSSASHTDAMEFRDQAWAQLSHMAPTTTLQKYFRHGTWV